MTRSLTRTAALAVLLTGCAAAPPVVPTPEGGASGPAAVAAPAASASASASGSGSGSPAAAAAPAADDPTALARGYAAWIEGMRATARAAGIDEPTLHAAFDQVQYLPRVIELDRSQPEFTRSVWDYLDGTVSDARVALGHRRLAQVRVEADAAAARYGVPPEVVAAIWGIESNFGSNYGDIPTIDALATLGYEGRRAEWARGQLLAALKILRSGDIDRAHMIGSWAGAMGQTQFLPTTFLAYAVDADGDGRRDIWGSMADVLASTANDLAQSGWRAAEPWGVEVRLPAGYDLGRADGELRLPSARWNADGIRTMDGSALPEITDAALMLPGGARGPAFLVGANFRAILRYNNSISYALAVGLLSQRLAGGPGVVAAWPRDLVALTRSQLLALQTALNARGFASGAPDGMLGPATRAGLRGYQRSLGLPADGYPTLELLQGLTAP